MSHFARTIPTAAKARAAIAATAARPAPRPAPSATVFGVVAGALVVLRDVVIEFPFTGASIAFAAGTEVHLLVTEDWNGGDSIVIVVETATIIVDPDRPHRLTALPRALANPGDTIVGGFDLDPDCAVLAGSFWDANLADHAANNAVGLGESNEENSVVTRMADVFVARQRDGYDDTTHRDLVREGFSEAEIMTHYDAAASRAAARQRDAEAALTHASYDRQGRIMTGAVALAGEFDPNRVNTTLRLAGLTTREIGNLFDDIIGESLRLVREGHAALADAVGQGQSQKEVA